MVVFILRGFCRGLTAGSKADSGRTLIGVLVFATVVELLLVVGAEEV